MDNNIFGLVLVLLAMVIVNKLMAIPQAKKMSKQLMDLKKTGPVSSVGLARRWFGNRAYILITELNGDIISGYCTSGILVFSGFKKDTSLKERHYSEIIRNLSTKKKLSCTEQAKQMAAKYLEQGLESSRNQNSIQEELA